MVPNTSHLYNTVPVAHRVLRVRGYGTGYRVRVPVPVRCPLPTSRLPASFVLHLAPVQVDRRISISGAPPLINIRAARRLTGLLTCSTSQHAGLWRVYAITTRV